MITQKELKELLHYDPLTGVFTWKVRKPKHFKNEKSCKSWNTKFSTKEAGYLAEKRRVIRIKGKNYYASRLAFIFEEGYQTESEIDHINRDSTDNRWSNLRIATRSQNAINRNVVSSNTSGHTGISWDKKNKKWMAKIGVDNKTINLGRHNCITSALFSRKKAEVKYFGQFKFNK